MGLPNSKRTVVVVYRDDGPGLGHHTSQGRLHLEHPGEREDHVLSHELLARLNFTPLRRLNVHSEPSVLADHDVASAG